MEASTKDIDDYDEIIEPDIMFDQIISYNMNSVFEDKIMKRVEKLLEEKNKKISELEDEVSVMKGQQDKLQDIINCMVRDFHYSSRLRNIQPIYDDNGKIINSVINEGWIERRIPVLVEENGAWKRYKLDGKIYELKGNGVVVEIKEK